MSEQTDQALPCPHCGYDLRGQTVRRCPECGEEFDPRVIASLTPPMSTRTILLSVFGPPLSITILAVVLSLLYDLVGGFRALFAGIALMLGLLAVLFGVLTSFAVGTEFGMRMRRRLYGPISEPNSFDMVIGLSTVFIGLLIFGFQAAFALSMLALFDLFTARIW